MEINMKLIKRTVMKRTLRMKGKIIITTKMTIKIKIIKKAEKIIKTMKMITILQLSILPKT